MLKNHLVIVALLAGLGVGGLLAAPRAVRADDGWHAKNLKVLPKDISKDQIKHVMKGISKSLGVKCEFCHVKHHFDADTKMPKKAARHMMKMVNTINGQFLNFPKAQKVTCWTCHRGHKKPAKR